MNTESYVVLQPNEVSIKARAVIVSANNYHETNKKKRVAWWLEWNAKRGTRWFNFWQKPRPVPEKFQDQYLQSVRDSDLWARDDYWRERDRCERLLAAANYATGSELLVSTEDIRALNTQVKIDA